MSLRDKIRDDLNNARKERDKLRTMLLTTTLSEVKNKEIDLHHDLSDAEVVDVIQKAIKRRKEAAEQMRAGNRIELAEKEEAEAAQLAVYLPAQLSEDEVRAIIREAIAGGANTIGAVMGKIAPRIKGVFDGKAANALVKSILEGAT